MSNTPAPSQSQLAERFMSTFSQHKIELSQAIDKLSIEPSINNEDVTLQITNIANDIQNLSKSLHDVIIYLPSYSVKMRQSEIRDLEKALKDKEDLLIPKKKFGFRSQQPPSAPDNKLSTGVDNEDQVENKSKTCAKSKPTLEELQQQADANSNFVTIENLKGTSKVFEEEILNGCDVLVRDIENVTLYLHGSPSTLRIKNAKNCRVICGPVSTSVFVDSASDCLLFLCCKQLRTHSSTNTDIYLRVFSRAIIEDCNGIRFAPYNWTHPRSEELHRKIEIPSDLQRFEAVDDFNWLSASQSPNWSIIPDIERVQFPPIEQTLFP